MAVSFQCMTKFTTNKKKKKFLTRRVTCANDLRQYQGFPGGSLVKILLQVQEMQVQFLSQKDSLEEEMATHSSIFA